MSSSTAQPAKRRRIENNDNSAELLVRKSDFASQAMQNLYLNPAKVDVYFVCGDQKDRVPAHKLILSTLSNVFNEMFYGESTEKDKVEVELPHTSPGVFEEFLQLFYFKEVNFHDEYITEIINLIKGYRLPERLLYDMQIPFGQESPQNILNALNDDCIQTILRKLNSVHDYLNAIDTCTRFKQNAKAGLSSKLVALHIREDKQTQGPNDLTIEQVRKFLDLDVVPVQTINWVFTRTYPRINQNLNLIADAFGKSLTELKVTLNEPLMVKEELNLNTRSPFQALKKLSVRGFNVPNFEPIHSQLVALNLDECDGNAFERHFTMLKEFDFCGMLENNIGRPNLLKFLQLNPQLTRLKLRLINMSINPAPEDIIDDISILLPHLDNLSFLFSGNLPSDRLVPLSRLRKLQHLRLEFSPLSDFLNYDRLLDALAANDVRIEELTLFGYRINDTTQLGKLKYLRKLSIEVDLNHDPIDIILNSPNLEEIRIRRWFRRPALTIPDIRGILECETNLKRLRVYVGNIIMNLEEYNSLLALVEGRLEVRIYCEGMKLPANVLEANNTSKWLKIEKTSSWTETYIGKFGRTFYF